MDAAGRARTGGGGVAGLALHTDAVHLQRFRERGERLLGQAWWEQGSVQRGSQLVRQASRHAYLHLQRAIISCRQQATMCGSAAAIRVQSHPPSCSSQCGG